MRTKRKHIGVYCDAKKRFYSDFDNTCTVLVVMYYIVYAYMFNGFSSKAQSARRVFKQVYTSY